jgi:hypothetical protein
MTRRAIVIGLVLGAAVAAVGYFSDWVLKLTYVSSDLAPFCVFGPLVAGLLLVNPFLRWAHLRPLKAGEIAVIVSLLLVASVIPGPGLMWNFTNTLIMPLHYADTDLGWQKNRLVELVPPVMLADAPPGSKEHSREMAAFRAGLRTDGWVAPCKVPWHIWGRTLSFWLPLLGLTFVAGIALMLALHHHWSGQEHLRYPVADFAGELLRDLDGNYWPAVFRNRWFWAGFGLAFGTLAVNGLSLWYPQSVQIPLGIDLTAMTQKWPELATLSFPLAEILRPRFFFAAIGLAYFVSTEVSLSVGVSTLLYAAVYLAMATSGVRIGGNYFGTDGQNFLLVGAYVGMALLVFHTGRRFYVGLLARSVGVPAGQAVDARTLWAFRAALAAAAGMVAMLCAVGLETLPAVLLVVLGGVMFIVLTRISVESGLFFIQPTWQIAPVLAVVLGWPALGPKSLLIVALVSTVICVDPRVCLMPMVANAMQISQNQGLRPQRVGAWMVPAVLLALAAGVVGTLYVQYNYGGNNLYDWADLAARQPFDLVNSNFASFMLGSGGPDVGVRLHLLHPDTRLLSYAGAGMALVLACGLLRLRINWWPLHPVLFLVWGTLSSAWYGPSFLAGWMLKSAITRLGGARSYNAAKPIFVGLVAGEFATALLWAVAGLVYYLKTGYAGPTFRAHL